MRRLKQETKKERLLRLLEERGGSVPLEVAARELYGKDGEPECMKVIRLLSAYRAKNILNRRVRNFTVL
ncbi:hypothetical protein EDD75_2199 [Thermodesulfitimonas autotrophica]|uniref:Uncharacterized protein n=1 Tax=Thermodesulfitimonas autotrophica TaxID=1894989 RepID=A0A3N5B0U5_9THEO|nr:hypothetical protein [Thermodesulfitimonas autotrophica]RPF43078.1 hypothetical protein EDD75_2199 [Thermodesulfitimonas autotrophica]